MNKSEFVERIAEETGHPKILCAQMVEAVFSSIAKSLKQGEPVNLIGFGNFVVKRRQARMGRNPRTGEPAPIAASNQPSFKAGKSLKDTLNS